MQASTSVWLKCSLSYIRYCQYVSLGGELRENNNIPTEMTGACLVHLVTFFLIDIINDHLFQTRIEHWQLHISHNALKV